MKTFLFVLLVTIGGVAAKATPPINIEKTLNTEIIKLFKNSDFTLSPLETPTKYNVSGQYFEIKSTVNQAIKYAYAGRVLTNRSGNQNTNDTSEFLDYAIFYNPLFTIQKIKVLRFNSNHGAEVCSPGWLRQFTGHMPGKNLMVGKNIDAISGATATVNCLTFDIQSKTRILNEIKNKK